MALISSHFSLKVFLIIYILINIVHGNPVEVNICTRRIESLFGNCNTATACLRYAIEHYIYDENTANLIINNQNFAGQSSQQEDSNQLSDEQLFAELGDQLNFDGLRDFIETDSNNYAQGYDDQTFYNQAGPNYNVPSSNTQFGGPQDFLKHILNLAKQYHYTLPVLTDGKNYETHYHKALVTMITGNDVKKPNAYCYETYQQSSQEQNFCKRALVYFGTTAKSAVKWAFTRHTLAECVFLKPFLPEYVIITNYMGILIGSAKARPAKTPSTFCEDFVNNS